MAALTTAEAFRYLHIPDEVEPNWAARRRLGAALRALGDACVSVSVSTPELEAAAAVVEAATGRLGTRTYTAREAFADGSYHDEPGHWIDRSAVIGTCNPVAPPMRMEVVGDRSIGHVTLGQRHGGAPGIAHGGIVAACFDQVMGHAATVHGAGGLTVELVVRYRAPTPLDVPLRYESWPGERAGDLATFHADAFLGDRRIGSATARFKVLEAEQAARIFTGG